MRTWRRYAPMVVAAAMLRDARYGLWPVVHAKLQQIRHVASAAANILTSALTIFMEGPRLAYLQVNISQTLGREPVKLDVDHHPSIMWPYRIVDDQFRSSRLPNASLLRHDNMRRYFVSHQLIESVVSCDAMLVDSRNE
jgi:hypothetical protein